MLSLCKLPGLEETREEEGGKNGRRVGGRGRRAGLGTTIFACLHTPLAVVGSLAQLYSER